MAKKTHGLGRGLDSLFADLEETGESVREIPIGELDPNPDQPRRSFNEEGIAQLADSIRVQGILQPLLVAATGNGRYRIIAGERRYRAARQAGLETVPCLVKDIDVIRQMEIALIENLQREDLNPMEAARGVRALMDQCGYTQEKVGQRLGKSRSAVANLMRLLSLPDEVIGLVRDGMLSQGHAKALGGLEDREAMIRLARRTVNEGLTVRQLEKLVAEMKETDPAAKPSRKAPEKRLPAELEELQEKLRERIGMRSVFTGTVQKGTITLHYSTRDELERLYALLQTDGE